MTKQYVFVELAALDWLVGELAGDDSMKTALADYEMRLKSSEVFRVFAGCGDVKKKWEPLHFGIDGVCDMPFSSIRLLEDDEMCLSFEENYFLLSLVINRLKIPGVVVSNRMVEACEKLSSAQSLSLTVENLKSLLVLKHSKSTETLESPYNDDVANAFLGAHGEG